MPQRNRRIAAASIAFPEGISERELLNVWRSLELNGLRKMWFRGWYRRGNNIRTEIAYWALLRPKIRIHIHAAVLPEGVEEEMDRLVKRISESRPSHAR